MKNNALECLLDFKNYIRNDVTKHCRDKYGKRVCGRYIYEFLDNMLESFEEKIDLASLEVLREDDLNYDQNFQGE
jgi:hypothetical protein